MSKRKELEALLNKYPDVPREVIIKEDILRVGLAFTEAALKACEGYRTKTYGGWHFTFDLVRPDQFKQGEVFRAPDYIELKGGLYNLRGRVRVRCRLNPDSPYIIDVKEGKLWLCEKEGDETKPLAELHEYRPKPRYWSMNFPDGTPYREICREESLTVYMACQHWGPKEECKFCDINESRRLARARGDLSIKKPYKEVDKVVEVVEQIFLREREERPPYDRPKGLLVTGGAITKKLDGLKEIDFYLRYITPIKERIGNRWPISLATAPYARADAKRLHDAGVNNHSTNMEVWDKRLFGIICPGKNRVVGWDQWLKLMLEEVDIFGEGHVSPGFVMGVELSKPWGFKEVKEAINSYREGFEFLMSHGVVPRPVGWCVEPYSALKGQEPPPTEYFIEIDRLWYEILRKYRLPAPGSFCTGPGVNEYPNNASFDME